MRTTASAGSAYILIKGDFGPLRAGLRNAEHTYGKQVDGLGNRLKNSLKTAAKIGGLALAAGAAVGAKKSVDAAVDLGEQINKTKVVFRGAEKDVLSFGESTAKSLGISNREALEAAGTFGNMFVPMGIARKEAALMSVEMVRLAADMASFNNASPEETLHAIRSGLAGESEPLRRFGVDLREAALQEFALTEGIKKSVKEMSNAEKAQLAYKKIINDTGDAQGDFARTSDSLANQQRTLRAQFEDIGASLGKALLPALQKGASAVSDFANDVSTILNRRDLTAGEKFDRIGDEIAERLEAALPVIAEAAGRMGPRVAVAFAKGFLQAPALVQLATGAWLFAKSRKLLTAFGVLGTQAGAAFSAGAATTAGIGGAAGGAAAGGLAGGALAGAAGGAAGAAAKQTKALQLVFGKEARSGAPVSQLGPKVGGFAGLADKLKGFAKTGVWTAVGVVAADTILKGLEDRVDTRSSDLKERLKALGDFSDLEEIQDTFTLRGGRQEDEVRPAKRLQEILEQVKTSRRGITAAAAQEAVQLAKNLDLTRAQRTEVGRLLEAGRVKARGPIVDVAQLGAELKKAGRLTPDLINQISTQLEELPRRTRPKFAQAVLDWARELKKTGQLKGSLSQLKNVIEAEVDGVGRLSVRGPSLLRKRVAAGFEAMVEAVADPTSRMAQIVQTYLEAFGAAGIEKISGAIARDKAVRGKGKGGQQAPGGFAKGGFLSGQGKRDTVPVMAAPGEAFLTRHQQVPVERALRTTYGFGLDDLFKRQKKPHYMAQGGFVQQFKRGGKAQGIVPIPGQPGESIHSSILKDVLALIKRYNLRVTDGFAASGHAAGGEHPKGLAIDVVPGAGGSWNQIDRLAAWAEPSQNAPRKPFRWVGYTGDAGHGRGDHLHLSWGGGGGGVADVPDLPRIEITGRRGAPKSLAQAAAKQVRRAAQQFLDRESAAGAPVGTESDPGESVGSGAGLMRRISQQRGWSFPHWWALDAKETSHGRNLSNPESTARLRAQFLDMNYGKYGPGSDPAQNPSMAQQIRSMARYIAERYGNPSRALAFHNAHNYYERGGFIEDFFGAGGLTVQPKVQAAKKDTTKKDKSTKPRGVKDKPKAKKKHGVKNPRTTPTRKPPEIVLPIQGMLERVGVLQEQMQAAADRFDLSDEEFYPDEKVIDRLRRGGHNIEEVFALGKRTPKTKPESFIDWTAVLQKKDELTQLSARGFGLIGKHFGQKDAGLMETVRDLFAPTIETVQRLINFVNREINTLKERVRENQREVRKAEKRIEKIDDDRRDLAEKINDEKDKKKPNEGKLRRWRKDRADLQDEKEALGERIKRRRKSNRDITGQSDPSGDLDSTDKGELGAKIDRRDKAVEARDKTKEDQQSFVGVSGESGEFATQRNEIQRIVNDFGGLSDERIREAVAPSSADDTGPTAAQDHATFIAAFRELLKQYGSNISPLKAFAKGGRVREALALVGEKGYELAKHPSGKAEILGQAGPEIRELPRGTRVFSHPETRRKLGVDGGRESPRPLLSGALGGLTERHITEKLRIPAFAKGGVIESPTQDGQVTIDPKQLKLLIDQLKEMGDAKREVNIDLSPQFREQPTDPHAFSKAVAFELEAAI